MCKLEKKRLVPEDKGRLVTAFLESFSRATSNTISPPPGRKARQVSNSEIDWKDLLRDFWKDFSASLCEIKDLRTRRCSTA